VRVQDCCISPRPTECRHCPSDQRKIGAGSTAVALSLQACKVAMSFNTRYSRKIVKVISFRRARIAAIIEATRVKIGIRIRQARAMQLSPALEPRTDKCAVGDVQMLYDSPRTHSLR
jgi:hypothetical protein